MKPLIRILLAFAAATIAGLPALARQDQASRTSPWPDSALSAAEKMPVQDGGRVKPLHTYASFLLLRLNGKRSVATPAGEKLEPVAWLLDVLFFPDLAAHYSTFLVQDAQAVEAIGVSTAGKKKRDRYSLHELRPGVSKLFELAREYSTIDEKQRSSLQQQVFLLAQNVDEYARLASHADFARARIAVGPGDGLTRIFGGQEETTFSQVLAKIGDLARLQGVLGDDAEHATERKSVTDVLHATIDLTSGTESLALIPPSAREPSQAAWHSPADIVVAAFDGAEAAPEHVEILAAFERLAQLRDRPTEFAGELQTLAQRTESMASARAEYGKIGLEVAYYKAKLLTRGLATFILAFVLVSVMWMRPRNRWLYLATNAAAVVATTLLIAAIVMRCIIRERPPVSTLYETVLFVTAVGTSVAIAMEWINRQRVALSAAVAMGIIGLFIANGYEMLDKRDTMPSLVAVLDTNFWLSTHVTSITVGYSAGMLAALLATIYLIGRMIPRVRAHASFGKTLARMVYGALSFSLVFSVVGTILGGIWANESWGRFWGWDPKENGAMLICLAEIAILHGRMGGYLRDFGVAMACGFNGTVIAFSWWGVNLLGVGLHSYGFTSGIHTALWSYYLAQWGLLAVCGVHALVERARREGARVPAPAPGVLDPRVSDA